MEVSVFDFSEALKKIKAGRFVCCQDWGEGMYLFLKEPLSTDVGAPTVPYIALHFDGNIVPWPASQFDILNEEWMIAGPDMDMRIRES